MVWKSLADDNVNNKDTQGINDVKIKTMVYFQFIQVDIHIPNINYVLGAISIQNVKYVPLNTRYLFMKMISSKMQRAEPHKQTLNF